MCTSPLTLRINRYGEKRCVVVPCGHCYECAEQIQREWSLRISEESGHWRYNYFLTLTYSDENIPYVHLDDITEVEQIREELNKLPLTRALSYARQREEYLNPQFGLDVKIPTVSVNHLQNWFKRCRRSLQYHGVSGSFKYVLCSEYGPNTFRPHYHVLIMSNFTVDIIQEYFVSAWEKSFGRVDWKKRPCDGSTGLNSEFRFMSDYISKYLFKPSFTLSPWEKRGLVAPTFRLFSKGIGLSLLDGPKRAFNVDAILQAWQEFQDTHRCSSRFDLPELPPEFRYNPKTRRYGFLGSDFHGFSKPFMEYIYNSLRLNLFTNDGKSIFSTSLPRYIKYLACRTKTAGSEEFTQRSTAWGKAYGSRSSFSCSSVFSCALSDYVCSRLIELYDGQYRALFPNDPVGKTDAHVAEFEKAQEQLLLERKRKAYARVVNGYTRHKLKNSI